ncbi:MAG: TIM barrel protein [Syntrophus sp. (in: bacteria)]|nr:TIM barrel protein [Syntrophus sp. (in: bacteria)]
MQPQIAMCNIFDQDADQLAEFASRHGFSAIDWSIDPSLPEEEFLARAKTLSDFQLRYHCRFFGVDIAYADRRGDDSLELLMRTVDMVAQTGARHMTIHSGLGNRFGEGISLARAIDNLSVLVQYGKSNGVAVALENLMTPLTNDPFLFHFIVSKSDAFVTIDIGHAHAIRNIYPQMNICGEYVLPNRDKLLNAHIYNTELEGYGHIPPTSLQDIASRLDLLSLAAPCDWWVIELMNPKEVLSTRDFLVTYLDCRSIPPVAERHSQPLPLFAA